MKNFVLLSLLILCLSCQNGTNQSQQEVIQIDEKFTDVQDAYYFYTIGDWGRGGELGQAELAQAMGQAAGKVEPEFIVSTGDNFYPNGVASTSDPQWMSSFENVYSAHSLNCDWYVVLGNHDYRGNPQAEIDYSQVSRRWNMPARYFHKDIITDEGASVRFVFADTSPLNYDYYQEEKYQNKVAGQDTTAQMMWLDSMLAADFDWKIVVGHHPLCTGGKRVDEPNAVRNHLEPLLEKNKVALYIAGHEHDLQHIKPENYKTHHFVSGAGSDLRPVGEIPETKFAASVNGFLSVAITSESLLCQFVDAKGQVIYETAITQ